MRPVVGVGTYFALLPASEELCKCGSVLQGGSGHSRHTHVEVLDFQIFHVPPNKYFSLLSLFKRVIWSCARGIPLCFVSSVSCLLYLLNCNFKKILLLHLREYYDLTFLRILISHTECIFMVVFFVIYFHF